MDAAEPDDSPPEGRQALDHERRVAHLRTGYENSQAAVRFLDAKATAAVGAIPIVLAAVAGVASWIAQDGGWVPLDEASRCWVFAWSILLAIIAVVVIALAGCVLWHAFRALLPRSPDPNPSILFPYGGPAFTERVDLFVGGGDAKDEMEDYRRQVLRMGEITKAKMFGVQRAFWWLRLLFLSAFVVVVSFGGLRLHVWLSQI